ncbi:MAG TPA: hypothetical protein VHO84_05690, partial [Syntrophorhabdaceae bacterium]|nr:hypothetical protein [Syntrophorhabdaceae bacterium]
QEPSRKSTVPMECTNSAKNVSLKKFNSYFLVVMPNTRSIPQVQKHVNDICHLKTISTQSGLKTAFHFDLFLHL